MSNENNRSVAATMGLLVIVPVPVHFGSTLVPKLLLAPWQSLPLLADRSLEGMVAKQAMLTVAVDVKVALNLMMVPHRDCQNRCSNAIDVQSLRQRYRRSLQSVPGKLSIPCRGALSAVPGLLTNCRADLAANLLLGRNNNVQGLATPCLLVNGCHLVQHAWSAIQALGARSVAGPSPLWTTLGLHPMQGATVS